MCLPQEGNKTVTSLDPYGDVTSMLMVVVCALLSDYLLLGEKGMGRS